MSIIDEIEAAARANYSMGEGFAHRQIGSDTVSCQVTSAMVNRGTHTGDVRRARWRINGNRASRAAVERLEQTI